MLLVATAAPALAQPTEAKINEDVFSTSEKGKAVAKAGGTQAKAPCEGDPKGVVEAKSGDIYAKAPCKPEAAPPPPPPPPTGAKVEEKKELPKTGGATPKGDSLPLTLSWEGIDP